LSLSANKFSSTVRPESEYDNFPNIIARKFCIAFHVQRTTQYYKIILVIAKF
jgi:hypothetical protein